MSPPPVLGLLPTSLSSSLRVGNGLGACPSSWQDLTSGPPTGYRHWHADLRSDDSPLEAGLAFTCKLKSCVPFLGREALEQQREAGLRRRLVSLTVEE